MNLFRSLKPLTLVVLITMLSACSSLPESQTSVEWQSHQQQLQAISRYQASGKLGYIGPDQRQSLNFFWRYEDGVSQLNLRTFLGQSVLNLRSDQNGTTLTTMDGERFEGRNGQQLIWQLTGLNIPVDALPDWLLGLPTNADSFILNEENTLESLDKLLNTQSWRLNYSAYSDASLASQTIPLPSRLSMNSDETKLNIVISKWVLNP
ncbi:lipoprotein insertase outer membrane protein LolB [Vibrio sp. WXL103]|uniref:lipoprotein insertase outer membrane protein LolB n=1 Tax=unclassified Vibrio TaxID=2614977 RepID=UPI003EC6CE78